MSPVLPPPSQPQDRSTQGPVQRYSQVTRARLAEDTGQVLLSGGKGRELHSHLTALEFLNNGGFYSVDVSGAFLKD